MSKSRKTQLGVRLDKPAAIDTETGAAAESPETATEETVPRPGRPTGRKNYNYDKGERFPGLCAKCQCTDSETIRTKRLKLPNDPVFSYVDLITCICSKCKQRRVDRKKCNPAE